jgi:hypothetical protein
VSQKGAAGTLKPWFRVGFWCLDNFRASPGGAPAVSMCPQPHHRANPQDHVSRAIRATDPLGLIMDRNLRGCRSGSRRE